MVNRRYLTQIMSLRIQIGFDKQNLFFSKSFDTVLKKREESKKYLRNQLKISF